MGTAFLFRWNGKSWALTPCWRLSPTEGLGVLPQGPVEKHLTKHIRFDQIPAPPVGVVDGHPESQLRGAP